MPSTSPGNAPTTPSSFVQILPGAPNTSLQSLTSFLFRQKRYIAYISGRQLNLLSSPTTLVQAVTFDSDVVAIAAETRTGNIAVASKREVWVLESLTEGWTKVWWQKALLLVREDAGDEAHALSWGNEGELLIGGSRQLSLFNTLPSSRTSTPDDVSSVDEPIEERRTLWSISVSSPVQYTCFSPSGEIIATSGRYDRLVKVWRRLSYEEGLFDYTYLPHPGAVTHMEWRPFDHTLDEHLESGVGGRHDEESELLFTLANDGVIRVWITGAAHDLDILILYTTVDLNSAIPESPSLAVKGSTLAQSVSRAARYAFIVPSDQFCSAVSAIMPFENEKLSRSLEHLREMSSKEPDVIVTLDGAGRMSAWGVQSIGHKRRPETPSGYSKQAFHISHAERLPLKLPAGLNARFEAWFEEGRFNVLAHSFSGYIQWWRGNLQEFFSPSAAGSEHLDEVAYWSGHQTGPITHLAGSTKGRDFISCNASRELAFWRPSEDGVVHNTTVQNFGRKMLDLVTISRDSPGAVVLEQTEADPCELKMSERYEDRKSASSTYRTEPGDEDAVWKLYVSPSDLRNGDLEHRTIALNNRGRGFGLGYLNKQLSFVLPATDHSDVIIHSSTVMDASEPGRIGFVALTESGSLLLYHLDMTDNEQLEPVLMATFESGVQSASLLSAHNEFAAVVSTDGNSLAILNLRDGYVEQRHSMGGQIRDIIPASEHNLIAVVYDTSVNILAQGRYEIFEEMPPWILVKQVSISGIGLTISALAWLGDGSLAIAAGNGIFLSSNDVPVKDLHRDVQEAIDADPKSESAHKLSSLAHHLKKPLPIWHPSLVAHTVRHGHWNLASNILSTLTHKLKFWSEGEALHPHLDIAAEHFYDADSSATTSALDESLTDDLMQLLDEKDLPEVSMSEQERLKTVLRAMTYCSAHVNGLDNAALRYLFSWRLQLLRLPKNTGMSGPPHLAREGVPEMHWREIAFAYHSTTQQPLLDILMAHYENKITWDIAQRLGLFAWLADHEALSQIFDALAQSAYRATSPPDPINASLYFLALHKKPTLLALWRIATWHKEQRTTMNFLRRDFTQPQNQTAAKKNAYALMGKKRFDYAAAFFLLAEDAASATSLLASQCDDIMLAIAVARLYSGDESTVLRKLLEDRLMPQAKDKGDRWLMSWCHSILREKDEAAEALVQPIEGVRTWHQDDPNTLTLYKHLRKDTSEYEYDAILRAARILRRMGLWLLALGLVSRWEFKPQQRAYAQTTMVEPAVNGIHAASPAILDDSVPVEVEQEPPSMLDGFVPPPTTAVQDDKSAREAKAAELLKKLKAKKEETTVINEKKPEPTQFHEPDANSLLDSFGF